MRVVLPFDKVFKVESAWVVWFSMADDALHEPVIFFGRLGDWLFTREAALTLPGGAGGAGGGEKGFAGVFAFLAG